MNNEHQLKILKELGNDLFNAYADDPKETKHNAVLISKNGVMLVNENKYNTENNLFGSFIPTNDYLNEN